MFSTWPIRVKLLVGLSLLVAMVVILSSGGLYTTYAYRNLAKSLSWRVTELPLAAELSSHVGNLRVTVSELRGLRGAPLPAVRDDFTPLRLRIVREQFHSELEEVENTLSEYCKRVEEKVRAGWGMGDHQPERETVQKIQAALANVHATESDKTWISSDEKVSRMEDDLERLQVLADELPGHLLAKLAGFADEVRGQYRTLIVGTWVTSVTAALVFLLFVRLFYRWIFVPLRILIHGSRRVAGGDFDYRIGLRTHDEMSELAAAMNDMTARFQDIRDDLDRKVQERTKQVVRNEQLASVGFLAAGVAHEINNPLASIAMCAESLEGRVRDLLESLPDRSPLAPREDVVTRSVTTTGADDPRAIIGNYLKMIQTEAFRCKEITEKLLDFSRLGPSRRQDTELGDLVQGVIDMIGHLGKYQRRHIEFVRGGPVTAPVNGQEIKQVVLNLLTNALESVADDGRVRVELARRDGMAELTVADDGCGMEPAVLDRVFEPFFTRRRAGQGTGLGLSITHRIVADHGGSIQASSPGAGQGAVFRVRLPLNPTQSNVRVRAA